MSSNNNKAHEHDPVLPRTDGERHLPDGKIPSSDQLERTESEDLEVSRMMEEVGLDTSMPIDPSSLKALQELLTPKRSHGKSLIKVDDSKMPAMSNLTPETTNEQQQTSLSTTPRVPSEVLRPIALGRVTSDLTMGLRSEAMLEEATDASTAGSTQRSNDMDKRILDQLQMQTALLLDLQRRVDELSHIVTAQQRQLQQGGGTIPTLVPPMHVNQQQGAAGNVLPDQQQQQQARNAPPQQEPPPQMIFFAIFTSIPAFIRSTRIAEICRVYWALHRRDMRGRIDMNLIFKILLVSVILLGKFSSKRNKQKNNRFQFYVMVFLMIGGFLWQTGYARFLYNFFIKERYVQRIWNGEDIVVDAQAPPRAAAAPQVRAQEGNGQAPQGNGFGLLRGGIPRAPEQAGFVGKVVMDIVYLFGSFVLSILPMWKAEARHQGNGNNQGPAEGQENEGDEQGGNDGEMQG